MPLQAINPATEEVVATYPESTPAQVDEALAQAHAAYGAWRTTSFAERAKAVRGLAATLRDRKAKLARLITTEMGKPITESEAEIEKCAWNCEYYADNGERFLANEAIATNARESYVQFTPLGVVLAIMPWNFPFWQVIRFAAPAMMAGNAAVLKHASNVPGCEIGAQAHRRVLHQQDHEILREGEGRSEREVELPDLQHHHCSQRDEDERWLRGEDVT